ncbi:MAG: DivIVA domain-containing protein [Oscillospiraceae bacterium]|nr:DivIVA domain-containing protein [Oscillospiraceae bacterium]
MADKELRKMNRTELIEIIYTLKQNDTLLRKENDELKDQLEDKTIRIDNAGSIAEAALSLNRVFEDAENASKQYLESAKSEADRIIEDAKAQAAGILSDTEQRIINVLKKYPELAEYLDREQKGAADERQE